ncbi:CopD family protein [Paracoccus sp. (in: a-proteobacteria)]|uniref:CopD family protein n=1 Tax=Paracoccus sp. TaxID=267 RepID=UPI0026DFA4E9|nr:CopD family protein [Paracoccus sp. (in: a-proteobacteria)]MDO5371032.1 CopD family protein [Paracoccus sp. (in: a-proteobacteria)]
MIPAFIDAVRDILDSDAFLGLVKFIHLGAIAVWVGGLIALPWLMAQRRGITRRGGQRALHRLHAMGRMLHIGLVSPAAVLAISSGIGLIFLRETYSPWFTAKLGFVVLLGAGHVLCARTMVRVFADDPIEEDPEGKINPRELRLTPGRAILLNGLIGLGAIGILMMVLMKPPLEWSGLAPGLFQPGALAGPLGLQSSDATMIPTP